jgi:hypothetical protein
MAIMPSLRPCEKWLAVCAVAISGCLSAGVSAARADDPVATVKLAPDTKGLWSGGSATIAVTRRTFGRLSVDLRASLTAKRAARVTVEFDPCIATPDDPYTTSDSLAPGQQFEPSWPAREGNSFLRTLDVHKGSNHLAVTGIVSASFPDPQFPVYHWTDCTAVDVWSGSTAGGRPTSAISAFGDRGTVYSTLSTSDGHHWPCGAGLLCPVTRAAQ